MALFKKKTPTIEEPMDLDAVMKKYDRESNTRVWEGTPRLIVNILLACFSLFVIYVTLFTSWLEEIRLTSFMAFIVLLLCLKLFVSSWQVCLGMTVLSMHSALQAQAVFPI